MSAPSPTSPLAKQLHAFCRRDFKDPGPDVRAALPRSKLWQAVAKTGTSLWLDTGDVEAANELWTNEFVALTTNNTLLNAEVQKGIYDELVPDAAAVIRAASPQASEQRIVLEIAFVLNAIHALKLVSTFDADVSVELHTALSRDADASYRYGKRFAAIHPERFIVKVPLTPEGLVAARRLSDDGIRINFTLGFSARQNLAIAKISRVSWVNVFMGRINSFLADNGFGDGKNAGEKATLASQREITAQRSQGSPTRQIGASIRGGSQVHELCGIDVMTIPTGAAKGMLELAPESDDIVDRTGDDPTVRFADGVEASPLNVFWDIEDKFRQAIDELAAVPTADLSADRIRADLEKHGVSDLFSTLDDAQRQTVADDGKIPVAAHWQDMVDSGRAAWDSLLTEAALASFTADQGKLDARVRGLL